MLEWAASWAGVLVLDNEVHIFHCAAIHKLRILLTDAGLCCWYFTKHVAETEATLHFRTLLPCAGEEVRFLNPLWLGGVDEEDKWNGFENDCGCEPITGGAFDNMINEDGNNCEDVGAAQSSGVSANRSDDGLFYGDPIDDEEVSGEAFD
jgi:hypothetical protein